MGIGILEKCSQVIRDKSDRSLNGDQDLSTGYALFLGSGRWEYPSSHF
jgi:hypothetical protein